MELSRSYVAESPEHERSAVPQEGTTNPDQLKIPSPAKKGWLERLSSKVHDLLEGPVEDEAIIVGEAPKPSSGLSPDKRVDVLLSLYNNTRNSIHHWEDRIFQASILTSGAMLSAVGFFLQQRQSLLNHRTILSAAVLFFGLISWGYLILATRAHANNGRLLVKIEAALGLCEHGLYITGRPFFGYSGRWIPNERAAILLLAHLGIVAFSTLAIAFYR